MPFVKMHADVSREVIVVGLWEHRDVMIAVAKIVSADSILSVAEPCGILLALRKPFLVARAIAIALMVWATAQEIVAVRTVLLAVLLGPANCVCASTTHSAVKRCGMPIVSHGLPKSALEIVDVTQLVPKKAVRKGLSRSREVVALKQKRRAV